MPDTIETIHIVALDLDDSGQPVQALVPRVAASEAEAIEDVGELGAITRRCSLVATG